LVIVGWLASRHKENVAIPNIRFAMRGRRCKRRHPISGCNAARVLASGVVDLLESMVLGFVVRKQRSTCVREYREELQDRSRQCADDFEVNLD
jgi:hypothetical protein